MKNSKGHYINHIFFKTILQKIMDACYLHPKKRYIFQLVNLTGNLRFVLGTQVGYIIVIDIIIKKH
jgi:hypothetical protein